MEKGGPSLSEKRYPFGENRNGGSKSISLPFLIFSIDVPFPPLFNDRVIARDENVTGGNCVKTENGESI